MELVEGMSLSKMLKKNPEFFTISNTVQLISYLGETLKYLHQSRIVHQSLKPGNILIPDNQFPEIKLVDFGLAHFMDIGWFFQHSDFIETLHYYSPEQTGLLKRAVDHRSDLYSLGIIFYELLTGAPPFQEKEPSKLIHQHLAREPQEPSKLNPEIPHILERIVLKLLRKEPDDRYQSVDGFLKDLEQYKQFPDDGNFISLGLEDQEEIRFQLPLIGREEELATLKKMTLQKTSDTPSVIYIRGKSGLGKSKLIQAFEENIRITHPLILSFKCTEATQNMPFSSLNQMLRHCFQYYASETLKERIVSRMGDKIHLLQLLFPFLKNYFEAVAVTDENSFSQNEVQKRREEIFSALSELLMILGEFWKKIFFFLDDLQWMDPESLAFFLYITQKAELPFCSFIFTENPESVPESSVKKFERNDVNFFFMELRPLENKWIPVMVHKFFHTAQDFKPEFYRKIEEYSLGNPFYIIEVLKNLYLQKIVYHAKGKWELDSEKLETFKFENDVYSLLLSRLSNLDEEAREVLSLASVIGREFDLKLLTQLYEARKGFHHLEKIIHILDQAKEEGLIEENVFQKGLYWFFHEKLRESLYLEIETSERKQLHLLCAEILENWYEDNPEEGVFLITYHYQKTNYKKKFLHYCRLSYHYSLSRYAIDLAIYYLRNVVDFYFENQLVDRKTIPQILDLMSLMQRTGSIDQSFEYLQEALSVAQKNSWEKEEVELATRLGTGYYFLNKTTTALSYYEKALSIAEEKGRELEQAYPYTLIGSLYYFHYQLKSAALYLTKAVKYLSGSDMENTIRTYGVLAWTHALSGHKNEALEAIKSIEELIPQLENPMLLSQIYHYASISYSFLNENYEKALDYARSAYGCAEASSYRLFLYSSLCSQGIALVGLKRYDEALEVLNRGIETAQENHIFIGIYIFYAYIAVVYLEKGDLKKAGELVDEYLKEENKIQEKLAVLIFYQVKAICLYNQNKINECQNLTDKALEIYRNTDLATMGIFFLEFQIHLAEKEGNEETARNVRRELTELLEERPGLKEKAERNRSLIEEMEKNRLLREQEEKKDFSSVIKEKFQLKHMIEISRMISTITDLNQLLESIVNNTLEVTGAERGTLLLYDDANRKWSLKVQKSFGKTMKSFEVNPAILKKIEENMAGLVFDTLNKDSELPVLDQLAGENVLSFICAPLIFNDRLLGVLYLDSQLLRDLFNEKDLEMLNVFTTQAALTLEHALLYEKMKTRNQKEEKKTASREELWEKYNITKREREIIDLVLQGYTNKEISKKIFVSLITVKMHLHNIYQKAEVKNRVELVNIFAKT
jgi:predicted ATPase/DNA-binding CsgD family transcriptional regulator